MVCCASWSRCGIGAVRLQVRTADDTRPGKDDSGAGDFTPRSGSSGSHHSAGAGRWSYSPTHSPASGGSDGSPRRGGRHRHSSSSGSGSGSGSGSSPRGSRRNRSRRAGHDQRLVVGPAARGAPWPHASSPYVACLSSHTHTHTHTMHALIWVACLTAVWHCWLLPGAMHTPTPRTRLTQVLVPPPHSRLQHTVRRPPPTPRPTSPARRCTRPTGTRGTTCSTSRCGAVSTGRSTSRTTPLRSTRLGTTRTCRARRHRPPLRLAGHGPCRTRWASCTIRVAART